MKKNKKISKKPLKKAKKAKVAKAVKKMSKKNARRILPKRVEKAAKKPEPKLKGAKKAEEFLKRTERLMLKGKERGFVTYDEILKEFPHIEEDIIFLEDLYGKLSTAGIDVLEGGGMLDINNEDLIEKKNTYHKSESSYDSIQMYLKEIGQYPLILAQQEKDLAKRIEKGDMEA